MSQLVQNLIARWGWCKYKGVRHCLGFGMCEVQVLFPGETGSAAIHQRGLATLGPSMPPCQVGGGWISSFIVPSAVWSRSAGHASAILHLTGYPSPKSATNYTPFYSSYPGKLRQGACHPLPSTFPPPLARQNPAALPRVRRAGSI